MLAVKNNHPAVAELLIEYGADLNAQHETGLTALMFAATMGNNDFLKLLIVHNADSTICDNKGMRAMDFAAQQGNDTGIEILG
jgi:ankyrin repeat protein